MIFTEKKLAALNQRPAPSRLGCFFENGLRLLIKFVQAAKRKETAVLA